MKWATVKETKLRKKKKIIFHLCPLTCRLSHRWTSTLQGLHIALASYQGQGFIPWGITHAFLLTNLHHSLLSWTILLACLTSSPLFFKHSFMVSVHLFHDLPTEQLPAHSPTYYLGNPIPLCLLHCRTSSSIHSSRPFLTLHNSLIYAFRTLFILLIPSNPLRLSICTAPL